MKRWLLIAALLLVGIVGWTVPRGTPPSGCVQTTIMPDSVYVLAYSCSGTVNDTLAWKAASLHRRCAVRFRLDIEARSMEIARGSCEKVVPASVDSRRVAMSRIPRDRE